jgi:hypothetical protein
VKFNESAGAGHEIKRAEAHAVDHRKEAADGDFHSDLPFIGRNAE